MSKIKKMVLPILIIGLSFSYSAKSFAEDISVLGREIKTKNESAVITVSLVVKQKVTMQGKELDTKETKSDITGTIIDPSGLTVVSLIATEPTSLVNKLRGGMADDQEYNIESEISDIKLRLNDGQELPAKVVLRDKDYDLAFIQPVVKPSAMPYINLKENTQPQVLDQIITLSRAGKIGSWNVFVGVDRIEGIIRKPRMLYVTGKSQILGSPIFSPEGKFIGLIVLHTVITDNDSFNSFSWLLGDLNFMPVIIPAADIQEPVKQITAAEEDKKPEENKKEDN